MNTEKQCTGGRVLRWSRGGRPAELPFVLVNMAMTADGKIASVNRKMTSCGSEFDHEHLLELRSTADAVMAGARTVDSASVNLGPGPARFREMRIKRGLDAYNLRIIVSGSGSIDLQAEIFRHRFSPIIVLTTGRISRSQLRGLQKLGAVVQICGSKEIDFPWAFRWLKKAWKIERLLCEGGAQLNGALFGQRLVHELHLTLCPCIIGGRNAPTIADGEGRCGLGEATRLCLQEKKRVGDEFFLIYRVIERPAER